MDDNLFECNSVVDMLGTLDPQDAVQMWSTCRQARRLLLPFYPSLTFVLTRTRVQTLRTLVAWRKIWSELASFTNAQNVDAGLWAYATEVALNNVGDKFASSAIAYLLEHVLDKVIDVPDVLMVQGYVQKAMMELAVLALTPDDSYTLIKVLSGYNVGVKHDVHLWVYSDQSLENLMSLLRIQTNGRGKLRIGSAWGPTRTSHWSLLHSLWFQVVGSAEAITHTVDLDDVRMVASQNQAKLCRRARDSMPYTRREFVDWYGLRDGHEYWQEAQPWSSRGDKLSEIFSCKQSSFHDLAESQGIWAAALAKASPERFHIAEEHDTTVFQNVVHDEPPAYRDETVLSLQADMEWAEQVEQRIQHEPNECLMPYTCVLMPMLKGAARVDSLHDGTAIFGSGANLSSSVQRCSTLPARLRNMTIFSYACSRVHLAELRITSSHQLLVRRDGRSFRPRLAGELQVGDQLRTRADVVTIRSIEHQLMETEVVQLELGNAHDTMFIGEPGLDMQAYVEVLGAIGPSRMTQTGCTVKILSYMRFDNFRQALLECPELALCRNAMATAGVSADLAEHGLGPGKMFVHADQAWAVLQQLVQRGQMTRCSDVIVSWEYELLVRDLIRHHSPRAACREPHVEHVDIPRAMQVSEDRTFLTCGAHSSSSSMVTRSTTDAHGRSSVNLRSKRMRSAL